MSSVLSFSPPKVIAGAESHVLYDLAVAVRPTDGAAFVIGTTTGKIWFGRLGGEPVRDITGPSGPTSAQWPGLVFGNDGTGYAVWRGGNAWHAWLQIVPAGWPGGSLPGPVDISAALAAPAGAEVVSQPCVAFNRAENRLYAAGYFGFNGYAAVGFVESADGGRSWSGYKELARDDSRSNQSPLVTVGAGGDVHVISRCGDNLITTSRIGGVWDAAATVLANSVSDPGWDVRGLDGHVTKSVAVGPDGTAWAVWKHNITNSFGIARRNPGAGWQRLTTTPVKEPVSRAVMSGCAPDGTLYIAFQGDNPPYQGLYVLPILAQGPFSPQPLIPVKTEGSWGGAGVSLDFNGYGGQLWLAWTVKGNLPEAAYYASAPYGGLGPEPPPVVTPPPAPIVTPPPPVVPPPVPPVEAFPRPSSLAAVAISFNQVKISWKDQSVGEVEFSLERQETGVAWRIVGSSPANSTEWLDVIDIQPATTYSYRLRAHKTGVYSEYSNIDTTTTPPAPPPPPPPPPPVVTPPPPLVPPVTPVPPVAYDPDVLVMNGYKLGHGFLAYWQLFKRADAQHPLGLPISEEFDYVDERGKKYVVQGFERAVLGYDPTVLAAAYQIQPLLIGAEWRTGHLK